LESTRPVEEAISAELVLVDPELARRARVALPDPPWLLPVLAERHERPAPQQGPAPRPRHRPVRSRIGAALVGGCALLVFLILLASVADLRSRSDEASFAAAPVRKAKREPQAKPPAAPPKAQRSREARPKVVTTTRRVRRTRRRSAPAPKPTATAPRAIPATQRVFSWRPYAAAAYYQLYLQRGFTTVYQARTVKLRLALPARLKLRPGTYRVRVLLAIATDAGIVPGPTIVAKTIRI